MRRKIIASIGIDMAKFVSVMKARWPKMTITRDVGDLFLIDFYENNLNARDIYMAIKRAKNENKFKSFPPNPQEFTELCIAEKLGFEWPTFNESMQDAIRYAGNTYLASDERKAEKRSKLHPVTRYLCAKVGVSFLREKGSEAILDAFKEEWSALVKHVKKHGAMPDEKIALTDDRGKEKENKPAKRTKSFGMSSLASIKKLLL